MPIVLKSGSLNLLEPSQTVQACNGIALPSCVLHQHSGSLRLAVTGNRKLHHIYVLDQHGGSLRLVVTGNRKLHHIYRVSQEECARLREGVPYVKVYRYNPKYLCPKLNGYGDNCQRKVWSSCGSTHYTCQLTILSISVLECGVI